MAQQEDFNIEEAGIERPLEQTQITGRPAEDIPQEPPELDFAIIKQRLQGGGSEFGEIKNQLREERKFDFARAFNGAMADMLDLPGDATAELVNLIPWEELGFKELPSGGFRKAFEEMGLTVPKEELPDNIATSIGRFTGGTAPALLVAPFGAGQQAAQTAQFGFREGARNFAQQVGQSAVQKPATFAGQELAASTGAGFLGFAARENFPNSEVASFFGELAGGLTASEAIITPARVAGRTLSKAAQSFRFATGDKGGEIRAARRVAEEVVDPGQAISRLRDPGVSPEAEGLLTPAQRTGDPGLLALEKSIVEQSNVTEFQQNERVQKLNDVIVDSLSPKEGKAEFTREVFESQREYLKELLNARMEMATTQVQKKLTNLESSAGRAEANLAAKEEFRSALSDARQTENQLWQSIPLEEVEATPNAAISAWEKEIERFTRNRGLRADTLPTDLRFGKKKKTITQLLGDFKKPGKESLSGLTDEFGAPFDFDSGDIAPTFNPGELAKGTTLEEIQSMRSGVLAAIRDERGKTAPNADRIRVLNNLADALLTDMGVAKEGVSTETGAMIERALSFSSDLNSRFTRGPVAKILGFSKTGAPEIPDSLTLETMLSGGGPKAKENFDRMMAAVKKSPQELTGAVENFIKLEFQRNAVSNGKIRTAQAEAFLKKNEQVLNSFPRVRKDIEQAISSDNISVIRQRKFKTLGSRLDSPRVSKLALFIEKEPTKAFEEVFKSRDVEGAVNNIIKLAGRDPTGDATEGLREGFLDWILQRSKSSALTAGGGDVVSSSKFSRSLNDPKVAVMMQKILTPKQIERLRFAEREASIKDRTKAAKATKKPLMTDVSGKILRAIRVLGAQFFNKLSRTAGLPPTLQGPQFASQEAAETARRFALDKGEKILVDAFLSEDPKLLEALLKKVQSTNDQKFVMRQINAWLAVTLNENGESLDKFLLGESEKKRSSKKQGRR